jgi:hypothetical protein
MKLFNMTPFEIIMSIIAISGLLVYVGITVLIIWALIKYIWG